MHSGLVGLVFHAVLLSFLLVPTFPPSHRWPTFAYTPMLKICVLCPLGQNLCTGKSKLLHGTKFHSSQMKTFHRAQILVTELKSVLSEKLKISAFFVLKLFEHLCCWPVTFRPVTVHSVCTLLGCLRPTFSDAVTIQLKKILILLQSIRKRSDCLAKNNSV
jgi:hypothetical protein